MPCHADPCSTEPPLFCYPCNPDPINSGFRDSKDSGIQCSSAKGFRAFGLSGGLRSPFEPTSLHHCISAPPSTRQDESGWLPFIVKSRQFADIRPCLNKDANMTLVAVPGAESRSVTHRDGKTLLRNSANNMLIRRPYDVPRANLADNPVGFRRV